MKPYKRADRVSGHIQKALSDLMHNKIKDPRLNMVTITGVKMSPDLKIAHIFYTISDITSGIKKRCAAAEKGFKSALGYIKRTLACELGLRYMPDITFHYDESFDYGSRIDSILKSIQDHESGNTTS